MHVTKESMLASELASILASTFPTFRDTVMLGDSVIEFNCKGLALVEELYTRFHASHPQLNFTDHATLTAGTSSQLVSIALNLGFIELVETVKSLIKLCDVQINSNFVLSY